MMYYWEEKYENILDYAPSPKRGPAGAGDKAALKCVCKEESLTEQLDQFANAFAGITPPGVSDVLRTYFKDEICCCSKNYCKHGGESLPEEAMTSDLWELYTFFLNEFNAMDVPDPDERDGPEVDRATTPAPLKTTPGAESRGAPADSDATSGYHVTEPEVTPEDGDGGSALRLSPFFKLKVMEVVADCMKQKDIHRYHLLQHIKLLLHFYRSILFDSESQS